ncbi:MAG: sterol desaturase family protein [Verrucomicrobia bacterium]|nr:MAG: sterol desaturase family protein [Verrucomicrobiota bacterium]
MFSSENIQTGAFFALVLAFEILERARPAREVDRWKDLKIDAFSFALAIAMNRCSHYTVTGLVNAYAPAWLVGGWHGLQGLPGGVRIVTAIFLVDFMIYWIHRAQHEFDLLWRTHAWHHSIEQLYWFSGFRTSFLHSFLYNVPQAALPMLVFNLSPLEAGIGYSIGLLIQFWEHTNIDVNVGPLRYLIITPAYHRVHHSTGHSRTNFGTTFSLWDRLFGTYHDPAKVPADAPLGLGEPYDKKKMARMLIGV